MVGFITEPITTNRALDRLGTNAVPATTAEVVRAQFEESLARDPSVQIGRGLERTEGVEREAATDLLTTTPFDRDLSSTDAAVKRAQQAPVRLMDTNEANDRFGIEGKLKFDSPISERVADELNRLKREELQREDVFRRAQGGVGQWSARIGAGVVASALDPLNVASAFIPVVGPARYSLWLERAGSTLGRAGVRAGVGAAEGTVGAALVEPIVFAGSRAEQADYDATDSMLNIAFGTILGGGLHTAFGTIADQVTGRFAREIDALSPEVRESALRSSISRVAEGRPVDVEVFFPRAGSPDEALNRVLHEERVGWTDPMDRAAAQEVNRLSATQAVDSPEDGDAKALLDAALEKLGRAEVRIDEPEFRAAEETFNRSEFVSRAYEAAAACLSGRIS